MESMADNQGISGLVGIMDHLWFHQGILSLRILQVRASSSMADPEEQLQVSNNSSAHSSQTQVISEGNSSIISSQDDGYSSEQDSDEKEGPKRLNLSHSSSPLSRKRRPAADVYPGARRRLCKTMSCKSLCELELEEVKGFMDLGFTFDKEHLDKRMMSVLPGLQRLDLGCTNTDHKTHDEGRVVRPYLSEAWLVKRPDSPLLSLRVPRVSTADDMKKHLKYWAKTVASAIQLESS